MADPNSYLMFGLRPKDLPELGPGRAIDVRDGSELQIGEFGSQGLAGAVNACKWPTGGPAAIQALADHVNFKRDRRRGGGGRHGLAARRRRGTP